MEENEIGIEFDAIEEEGVILGLANTNALVYDPFAWKFED